MEIRIESMNKDNSHSWVRISHGLNKLVTNLNNNDQDNNNEQETSEKQSEEHALKLNASAFASRSKAKAKPQRRDPASSYTRTIPIEKRTWTDVEPGEYSLSDYPVSKKLINLLRHGSLPRETDGAIEFWRIKDYLQKYFMYVALFHPDTNARSKLNSSRTHLHTQKQWLPGIRGKQEPPRRAPPGAPMCFHPHG